MNQVYIKTSVRLPNDNEANSFSYIPFATYDKPGIIAFDENVFSINPSTYIVTLNINFTNQYYTKTEVYNKTEVDTFLSEKVSRTTESRRIYATDANGVTTTYPWSVSRTAYNTNVEKNSFVRRNEGRIPGIANPSDSHDAANKDYVDTGLSAKVDKLSGLNGVVVYVGNPDGTQTYRYLSNYELGNSIPLRDSNGNVYVGNAVNYGHAVNKGYVDTRIDDLDTGITISLSTKVDKQFSDSGEYVYAYNAAAQFGILIASESTGSTIVKRTPNGNVRTSAPTDNCDAATKLYVDTEIMGAKNYADTQIASQISRVYRPAGTVSFAELINTISPKIAVPIHYGTIVGNDEDASKFISLLNNDIKCEILMK